MTEKHTPVPWKTIDDTRDQHVPKFPLTGNMRHIGITGPDGEVYATVWNHHHYHEALANAEFIVRAVNSHEALLEAARKAHSLLYKLDARNTPEAIELRNAINSAGETPMIAPTPGQRENEALNTYIHLINSGWKFEEAKKEVMDGFNLTETELSNVIANRG